MTINKEFDSVEDAVIHELNKLPLDDANQSRAQIAISLARTLDSARDSTTGAMAQSIPGTAKQLLDCLKEIRESIKGHDDFLGKLMDPAPDEH